jgi:hypothetical protein
MAIIHNKIKRFMIDLDPNRKGGYYERYQRRQKERKQAKEYGTLLIDLES